MVRAQLDKRPDDVAAMFDGVAERYDLVNDVLSLGLDRQWRRAVAASLAVQPGERVLDLAGGTGTASVALARTGARCVACDFSLGMLQVGAARFAASSAGKMPYGASSAGKMPYGASSAGKMPYGSGDHGAPGARPAVGFVAGDALVLPFGAGVFDAVTISFGLRNVADPATALAEMRRVTRPGGRLLICEFGHLPSRRLDALYARWLALALPAIAGRLSGNPDAYGYLAESISAWPGAPELAGLIGSAGWSRVRWRRLSGGIVALHHAVNPG